MKRYFLRRLGTVLITVLAVSIIIFLLLRVIPEDPIELMTGPRVTAEAIAKLKAKWGLDKPLYVQYFSWLSRMLHGDFGTSIITHEKVTNLIWSRLPYTLGLTAAGMVISLIIGVPTGVISALKQYSITDYSVTVLSFLWLSMPRFWLGLLFMLTFGLYLRWLPISGYSGWASFILPSLTLGLPQIGRITRLMRTEMLEVKREDFVAACRAKGLKESTVIFIHALRNSIIPVVVLQFLYLPWLIGGAVVVETVFSWPGMGRLLYNSIVTQDFPVVQSVILIIAVLTGVSNFLGDVVSAWLDPRIRAGG